MTAQLFGELTRDGRSIALMFTGADDWDLQLLAPRLDLLTAQWKFPPGSTDVMLVPATWPTVIQLGRMFGPWVKGPALTEWIITEHVRRNCPPPPIPEDACPPWLKPYDYQREDAAKIAAAGKAAILHDPGCGKTALSVLGLEARRMNGHGIFPMIIIVPSWVVGRVWTDHIADWAPGWPVPVLYAGPDRKLELAGLKQRCHRDYILVTTYATARMDAKDRDDVLPRCNPETIIADEAHMIGNGASAQSAAVVRLSRHADQVLYLSGTLITHSMKNLQPVLEGLDHLSWPAWKRTKPRYMATRKAGHPGGEDIILGLRPEMQDEFFACLDGQFLRRAKDDVLDQLPPKIYSVRRPEMPKAWRHAYETMRDQMLAELPDGGELPVMSSLALFTRLSQLASSAADVKVTMELNEDTDEEVPHYHVTLKRPCWKSDAFLGLMAERQFMPTAVFTESRQLAMITGEDAIAAGLRTGFVTGPGDGPAAEHSGRPGYRITEGTKDRAVTDFQAGRLDVIVCTAGSGGLGITLTAGNCAAMLQRPLKLDLALQPEDRQHRPGAEIHDHVEIIDFVVDGTVDQYRRDLLKGKAGQWAQLIREPGFMKQLLGGLKLQ